jgi:DNA-binding NtrC family response regulator
MQVDLLRVLEEKKITRIGNCNPVTVDFRLISATRRNLEQEIAAGNFREDFFYRINVITIPIPPLRERKEDIPLLIEHFLEKYSQETTKRVDHITRDTIRRLTAYEWPGNVRELENAIERAVVLSRSRTLDLEDFSFLQTSAAMPSGPMSLLEMEKHHIERILKECGWNITRAAKILGINRVTLHKKIKRFRLQKNAEYSF